MTIGAIHSVFDNWHTDTYTVLYAPDGSFECAAPWEKLPTKYYPAEVKHFALAKSSDIMYVYLR